MKYAKFAMSNVKECDVDTVVNNIKLDVVFSTNVWITNYKRPHTLLYYFICNYMLKD